MDRFTYIMPYVPQAFELKDISSNNAQMRRLGSEESLEKQNDGTDLTLYGTDYSLLKPLYELLIKVCNVKSENLSKEIYLSLNIQECSLM